MKPVVSISIIAIVLFLSGCSSNPIKIVTFPAGATVKVGDKSCISPCKLPISYPNQLVTAKLPDGRFRETEVPSNLNTPNGLVGGFFYNSGQIMHVTALAFGLIGIGSSALFIEEAKDGDSNPRHQRNLALTGIVGILGFYVFGKLGAETKDLIKNNNTIEIEFEPEPEENLIIKL